MPPSIPDNSEKKAVLMPEGFGKMLITGLQGNVLALGSQGHAVRALLEQSLLQEQTFPSGPDGVAAKQEFSNEGGVIVQKGVVIGKADDTRVLVHQRIQATDNNPGHRVVTGTSILLSGDARKDAMEIVQKKLILPESIDPADVPAELMAVGGSSAKGINYLFLLYRMLLRRPMLLNQIKGTKSNSDEIDVKTRAIASKLVKDKPLEAAILKNWKNF